MVSPEQFAESVRLRLGYMRWVGLLFRWYIADEDGVSQDVALTRRVALRRAKGRAVRQFDGEDSSGEPSRG